MNPNDNGNSLAMAAVILCGGMGTRLRAVVSDRPKVLAEVAGRPFLDILIERLADAGVADVVLSVGYLRDQIKDHYAGTHILFAEEVAPLGTGGGVKNAEKFLGAGDHAVLIMNGDSWITGGLDLAALKKFHADRDALVTMVLAKPRTDKDYGVVIVDDTRRIIHYHEKVDQPGEHFMSAGIYLMDKRAFDLMPAAATAFSLEADFFPKLVGGAFYGFPIGGDVVDIGTPERFAAAQKIFYS
jgi:NDP-sugar pyrophosphorylase family protein